MVDGDFSDLRWQRVGKIAHWLHTADQVLSVLKVLSGGFRKRINREERLV